MTIEQRIHRRMRELRASLDVTRVDGADPGSYNVGWLEGALHELGKLVPSRSDSPFLVEQDGGWVCPVCDVWIDPSELGCGCGHRRPPR